MVVLSTQPSYKAEVRLEKQLSIEQMDGMVVHRISLFREKGRSAFFRLLNMIYFPFRITQFALRQGRFDIVMASTAPPVVVALAAAIGARVTGAAFFYHCMDIYPEIGRISGEFRNPVVFNSLRILDKISCGIAKDVIVLSEDMKKSLLARPGFNPDTNIQVINNFSMPTYVTSIGISPELMKEEGAFRVIFAGNIGRFQGLEVFVDAMQKLTHRSAIELVFVGEGRALKMLRDRAANAENIRFLPHQSVDVARHMIADADLGIVCLNPEIYKYAFPSKTMTYLEEGCPLLVSVERNSDLANFVEASNVGKWVKPGSADSIAESIESIYLDSTSHNQMKERARLLSKKFFSEHKILETWDRLVDSAVEGKNV